MLRILHVADRLSDRGGAYHYLKSLIAAQRSRPDHEVALWVGRLSSDLTPPCEVTRVAGLDARGREPVSLPPLDCDEVHLHNIVNPEVLELLGSLDGVRKRITVQDHRFFCPGKGKLTADARVCAEPMGRSLCRACFSEEGYFEQIFGLTRERLDALAGFEVEVLSHYMKRELVAVGVPESRIAVTPPRVSFYPGVASDDRHTRAVLFVGRLVAAKGVWDAVEAWKRSGVGIELPLVFAGTGPLRGELERRSFEVLGWIPHDRMSALYRWAAAVLMPSRWQEPFGIAGLEAQSLGTPVIAWDSGGVSEWHQGPRVAWGDIEALASALREAVLS